jgi:predicted transcriptional regulator
MAAMTLELTPELERRIDEWSREFKEPPQSLAVGLLEEYFEDSDTGAMIAAEVDAGKMRTYSREEMGVLAAVED